MRQIAIEAVFLLLVLKLPIVYVCFIVYWAWRAEPRPLEGAVVAVECDPRPWSPLRRASRRRPSARGPRGPVRSPGRPLRTSRARMASARR